MTELAIPTSLWLFFSFSFGAIWGSFLNVCIYRIPEKRSIVSPPSSCMNCGARIKPWQNVPVISYLILKGQCAECGVKIGWRYPLVELLTALLFTAVSFRFGVSGQTAVYWLLSAALVVITFIDLDHQIIPDVISLPGIPIGFACSFFLPHLTWQDSLLGILVGGGSLFLVAYLYSFLTGKDGMGGGDIKLLGMLGAFLGWQAMLPVIFFSSLLGTLVGIPTMLLKKENGKFAIPFGPFLATGALTYLFFGRKIIAWYLTFF